MVVGGILSSVSWVNCKREDALQAFLNHLHNAATINIFLNKEAVTAKTEPQATRSGIPDGPSSNPDVEAAFESPGLAPPLRERLAGFEKKFPVRARDERLH